MHRLRRQTEVRSGPFRASLRKGLAFSDSLSGTTFVVVGIIAGGRARSHIKGSVLCSFLAVCDDGNSMQIEVDAA